MTNSPEIAKRMKKACRGRVEEEASESREPAGYTDEVYREIARGMKAQMRKDGRITQGGTGCVCAVDEGEEGKEA
eukprot:3629949-Lingulodinium_polyedra.AAC.1